MAAVLSTSKSVLVFLAFLVVALAVAVIVLVTRCGGIPHDELPAAMESLGKLGFAPTGIIDIGANEGTWTQQMLKQFPHTPVFMIEANKGLEHFLAVTIPRAAAQTNARVFLCPNECACALVLVSADIDLTIEPVSPVLLPWHCVASSPRRSASPTGLRLSETSRRR